MKFFLDTANVDKIREANEMGVISGVTTNPSLIAKEGRDFNEVIKDIFIILKQLGLIEYHVNKEIDKTTGGYRSRYILDRVDNRVQFE